jgi:histone deacetylase 8
VPILNVPTSNEFTTKTDYQTSNMISSNDRVVRLVASPLLISVANLLPSNRNRSSMVHALIDAYLLQNNVEIVPPTLVSRETMGWAADDDFLDCVLAEKRVKWQDCFHEFGLEEYVLSGVAHFCNSDCPVFPMLQDYVRHVASATWTAASLLKNPSDVAVVWDGGRHHAQRSMASGFCYINDLVIGITELLKTYEKVLYIDLDVHHGDGVEDAFRWTDAVTTLSFHLAFPGFFPSTGTESVAEEGSFNVPLRPGLRGNNLVKAFDIVGQRLFEKLQPDVVVVQCGGDCLVGDPLIEGGKVATVGWNVGTRAVESCVKRVLSWKRPVLMTGGGGYNHANVARLDTALLAAACNVTLDQDIPDHEFYDEYGPLYQLNVEEGMRLDENEASALDARRLVQPTEEGLLGTSWLDWIIKKTMDQIDLFVC